MQNPYSLFGRFANVLKPIPGSIGRVFIMAASDSSFIRLYQTQFPSNRDGGNGNSASPSVHSTWASVITQLGTNRGDIICIDPSFATVPSTSEIASLEAAGVVTYVAGQTRLDGVSQVYRATADLPQTTTDDLFTVYGRVKLVGVQGVVTTAIQNQANDTKLTHNPSATGLASVDICAALDIVNDAVGVVYGITGTFANAMVGASNGAQVYQAVPVILEDGALMLDCAASNTGKVKWTLEYVPLQPGSWIAAA